MPGGLLVSFAGYPFTPSSLMPDNGLAGLAGSLVAAGHPVKVLDYGTVETVRRLMPDAVHKRLSGLWAHAVAGHMSPWGLISLYRASRAQARAMKRTIAEIADELSREIDSFNPSFVGFKLWNGDGFSASVELARHVRRRHPRVKVVGGGPQVDWFEEVVYDYTDAFHCLARGEGERTIVQLAEWADGRRQLQDISNVIYRAPSGAVVKTMLEPVADLDSLAMPCYDTVHYPSLAGDSHMKMVTIDESRGCPNDCNFCIHPRKSGKRWRLKNPQRLVAEMKHVMSETGATSFIYAGSNTPSKAAVANAQAIIDSGLKVSYACFGHAKGIRKADFDLMKASGCRAIFYGVESGSQRILDKALNKGTTVDEIKDILKRTREAGIYTIGSVIYPNPFEDEHSRRETLDLLLECRPDSVPVQFPGLVPGSTWDAEPERFGFQIPKGRRNALRYGLTYKIKLIYPPRFWKPLPYLLNGMNSHRLMAETARFSKDLSSHGLTTNIAHDMVLMADKLSMSPPDLRKLAMAAFFTGDHERIKGMVETINRK